MFGHRTRPAIRPKLSSLAATLIWTGNTACRAIGAHDAFGFGPSAFNDVPPMFTQV